MGVVSSSLAGVTRLHLPFRVFRQVAWYELRKGAQA
jgi:hypothetical protein